MRPIQLTSGRRSCPLGIPRTPGCTLRGEDSLAPISRSSRNTSPLRCTLSCLLTRSCVCCNQVLTDFLLQNSRHASRDFLAAMRIADTHFFYVVFGINDAITWNSFSVLFAVISVESQAFADVGCSSVAVSSFSWLMSVGLWGTRSSCSGE